MKNRTIKHLGVYLCEQVLICYRNLTAWCCKLAVEKKKKKEKMVIYIFSENGVSPEPCWWIMGHASVVFKVVAVSLVGLDLGSLMCNKTILDLGLGKEHIQLWMQMKRMSAEWNKLHGALSHLALHLCLSMQLTLVLCSNITFVFW